MHALMGYWGIYPQDTTNLLLLKSIFYLYDALYVGF